MCIVRSCPLGYLLVQVGAALQLSCTWAKQSYLLIWPGRPYTLLHLQGQAYTDPGATAYDAIDGAITTIGASGISIVNTMDVSLRPLSVASCTHAGNHFYVHTKLVLLVHTQSSQP